MALDMFLNLGTTIKGESQDKTQGPKGDVDILAWSWGMSQSGTTHTGGGGGAGKANFYDISITKYIDSATNGIMTAIAKGTHIPTCVLTIRKAGEGQQNYIIITMTEVIITSLSTGGSGGEDRLTENLSLNFAKVEFDYFSQKTDGSLGAAQKFNWNIATNSAD